jgi:hypothetical protein
MQGLSFATIPTMAFASVTAANVYLGSGIISDIEETAFNDFQVTNL